MARNQEVRKSISPKSDLGMAAVCGAVWIAIVMSSLGVVYTTFITRQATQNLEELRNEAGDLQVSSGKYLLEKSTLAAYTRVEIEAETRLDMEVPSIQSLEMVRR